MTSGSLRDRVEDSLLLLESSETKLALYATSDRENMSALRTSFEKNAADVLAQVKRDRPYLFDSEFLGSKDQSIREKLGKRVDEKVALLSMALNEKDQLRLRTLMHMGSCK